ncbi:MAG: hypothetical protein AAF618_04965, partial [Pseudomonadota bacterium]
LFSDLRDIPFPGRTLTPPIQLGTEFRRVQVTYEAPDSLLAGRIELSIALQYECDGRSAFDEIEAIAFQLLPERAD